MQKLRSLILVVLLAGFIMLMTVGTWTVTARRSIPRPVTVLFIGNSLTSKNNLPLQFYRIARAARKRVAVYRSLLPAATFEYHIQSGVTLQRLQQRNYTFVVMQEQSAYLSFGLRYAQALSWPSAIALKQAAGRATVVLYETWGYRDGLGANDTYDLMQDRISDGYERLRQRLGCQTAHVGEVWRKARSSLRNSQSYPEVSTLYTDDRHPTEKGTYLAASAIFAKLFRTSPRYLRPALDRKVPRAFARMAQRWVEEEGSYALQQ